MFLANVHLQVQAQRRPICWGGVRYWAWYRPTCTCYNWGGGGLQTRSGHSSLISYICILGQFCVLSNPFIPFIPAVSSKWWAGGSKGTLLKQQPPTPPLPELLSPTPLICTLNMWTLSLSLSFMPASASPAVFTRSAAGQSYFPV